MKSSNPLLLSISNVVSIKLLNPVVATVRGVDVVNLLFVTRRFR